jgi:secondary thiamine-phosphate synthase enzyme
MTPITLTLRTGSRTDLIEITWKVRELVSQSGIQDGICTLFVPHTTAAVTINENADPDVVTDMIRSLDKLIPWNGDYRHAEGNSAAHLKSSLTGVSLQVFISEGQLVLGTWQGIYFCEFDGPRSRKILIDIRK